MRKEKDVKQKKKYTLTRAEERAIAKENRRAMKHYEALKARKNVKESEYLTEMRDPNNIVEFDNLHTYFYTDAGVVKAVDGVSFDIPRGSTVCVVGESGCGKSVTSLSLMQLVQAPQGQITAGEIRYNAGDKAYNVAKMPTEAMRKIRGKDITMIFQEPMTSLNPIFTIGSQLDEVSALHLGFDKQQAKEKSIEMLDLVGIVRAAEVYKSYPHELSGGMRQRVMIAMALACNPKLIITHDLGVVAEMADYVVVMYAGRIIEKGTVQEIFLDPKHPYTIGLMKSKPVVGKTGGRLYSIPGQVPNPINLPNYCYFRDRCEMRVHECAGEYPCLRQYSDTHFVACRLENVRKAGE